MATYEEDQDLATDACPSPPRDEEHKWERVPVPNAKNTEDFEDKSETKELPKFTSKPSKPKTKKISSPKVYTNVININNGNGIHIGTNINLYWNKGDQTQAQRKPKDVEMTSNIKKLLVSQEQVTKKDILNISAHMDDNWRDTARFLDYSDGQIAQFCENFKNCDMKEVIYQFLLDWIQNNAEEATVEKLATALWECNQKDVVQRWSQKFSK